MKGRFLISIVTTTTAVLTFLPPSRVIADGDFAARGSVHAGADQRNASPPGLVARMTRSDGVTRTVTLEGVGCSAALCSRVAVRGKVAGDSQVTSTWLDTIAAIHDITDDDASVLFRNGTTRRLAVVHDNRFLYFASQDGTAGKIDLANIKSLEFLDSGR